MLSDIQRAQFEEDGFLILENVITPENRQHIYSEYAELIEHVASQRGHVNGPWHTLTFEEKFTQLVASDPDAYEFLDISLPLKDGIDESAGMHSGPAVFNLLTNPQILDIAESIVGPEVYSNPVQHVRMKPPETALNEVGRGNSNMSRTNWHQDAAVVVADAEQVPILTVWVAMTDATPEMGCMRAIRGSHHWQTLSKHCPGRAGVGEIFIPEELIQSHEPVNLSVKAGGVVLLNRRTWHGAGPNVSSNIRWSFDLRYQPPGMHTGRTCFPGFLARSKAKPSKVLSSAEAWSASWKKARTDIATGVNKAIFNERWEKHRDDPMCA